MAKESKTDDLTYAEKLPAAEINLEAREPAVITWSVSRHLKFQNFSHQVWSGNSATQQNKEGIKKD